MIVTHATCTPPWFVVSWLCLVLYLAFVPRVCAYVPWPLLAAAACGRVASRVCGCGDGRVMVYVMDMVAWPCVRCVAEIGPHVGMRIRRYGTTPHTQDATTKELRSTAYKDL